MRDLLIRIPKTDIYNLLEQQGFCPEDVVDEEDQTDECKTPTDLNDIRDSDLQLCFNQTLEGLETNIGAGNIFELIHNNDGGTGMFSLFTTYALMPAIADLTCEFIPNHVYTDIASDEDHYYVKFMNASKYQKLTEGGLG